MEMTLSSSAERALPPDEYLGPATVIEVVASTIRVEVPGGAVVSVEPAFVVAYAPAAGDVLLVIARRRAYYAIGVLHGAGRTVLSLSGDVEIRAEGGALKLWGEKGVEILGPAIAVQTDNLRVLAGAVTEKFSSLVQRVRGLMSLHVGESHTVVDEASLTKAKSATVLTEETMTINGKQIHLG